jgi:uncharacterized membrane protein YfcA
LLLTSTLAAAGFVQGLSGFGFGMVSMSLMPLFMEFKEAAVISTAFTLLATLITFIRHYREYDWRLGSWFILSLCGGLPVGVYFLKYGSAHIIIRSMGAGMLAYAVYGLLASSEQKKFSEGWSVPLGLFSGAMSGAFNLGGVPSAGYAYAHTWTRGQIMAFLQVVITVNCSLRMLFYRQAGMMGGIPWTQTLLLAVPLYLAIWLGHFALQRIDPKMMRKAIYVFIGLSGTYYLFIHFLFIP